MENYPKPKTSAKQFYHDIIHWYQVCQYPPELVNAIMKDHQPNTLGPYLQATPETVARVFVREYAIANQLTYAGIEKQLARITNHRKESVH